MPRSRLSPSGCVAALAGFALIGFQGLWVTMVAEAAGPGQVGAATGFGITFIALAIAISPPLYGLVADLAGNYRSIWAVLALVLAAAFIPALLLPGQKPHRHTGQPSPRLRRERDRRHLTPRGRGARFAQSSRVCRNTSGFRIQARGQFSLVGKCPRLYTESSCIRHTRDNCANLAPLPRGVSDVGHARVSAAVNPPRGSQV